MIWGTCLEKLPPMDDENGIATTTCFFFARFETGPSVQKKMTAKPKHLNPLSKAACKLMAPFWIPPFCYLQRYILSYEGHTTCEHHILSQRVHINASLPDLQSSKVDRMPMPGTSKEKLSNLRSGCMDSTRKVLEDKTRTAQE